MRIERHLIDDLRARAYAALLRAEWRWLANSRIDVQALYGPLIVWAIQHWQKPGETLVLALDTTMLWNRFCVVVLSVVCHGRAIPLLWPLGQAARVPLERVASWGPARRRRPPTGRSHSAASKWSGSS